MNAISEDSPDRRSETATCSIDPRDYLCGLIIFCNDIIILLSAQLLSFILCIIITIFDISIIIAFVHA
jgi:hypothetical protein